jgi:UDP:flavonoid glycosyltransferase YjiC (YdhE family)
VYVTLGSSGRSDLLAPTLAALSDMPLAVIAATAGRVQLDSVPSNVYLADFLPGEEAARRASLVICNGGSPTTQQALVHGKPVLGIPSNLDQYLNMDAFCRAGAARIVRAGRANQAAIRGAVETILGENGYTEKAQRLGQLSQEYQCGNRFDVCLRHVLKH